MRGSGILEAVNVNDSENALTDEASSPPEHQVDRLVEAIARLAARLTSAPDQDVTADHVCDAAVTLIAPCDAASVTIREGRRRFLTLSASRDTPRELDALQYQLDEGPCVDVAADRVDAVLADDLDDEPRWPRWAPAAVSAGMGSVVAVPLMAGRRRLGAINFYSERSHAWSDDDYHLAQLFTAHATVPLSYAHDAEGLTTAISNRHTIGVAQGILMRDYGLNVDTAFTVLQTLSTEQNIKVRELARRIVDSARPDGS